MILDARNVKIPFFEIGHTDACDVIDDLEK